VAREHGNFLSFDRVDDRAAGRTDDMRRLVELVQDGVRRAFGVELETEVVFWRRGERP
jgi:hypothetical protein